LECKYPQTTVNHRSSQRPHSISITRYRILSDKHAELEESRVPKAAKLAKFQSRHKEFKKEVVDIKASLAREQKTLAELTAQTKILQASTKNQEKELASINVRIDNLINAATPIREEIVTIMAQ
jgi:seryl-tRNA synthetase